MKLLHLSDFHLGHRCYGIVRRQQALRKNFTGGHEGGLNRVIEDIGPDAILVSGDLFDNSSPTYDDMDILRNWIHQTEEIQCPVIGITGNHEKLPDSFMQASEYFGIHKTGSFGDLKILCENHMYRSVLREYAKRVEECDILMLHQSMCGFLSSIMSPEIDQETAHLLSEKCSYLALGDLHIHNRMRVNNCIAAYPGPIDFLRVGESHNKFGGWLIEDKNGGLSSKSVEIKPYQKTHIVDIKTEEDYVKFHQLIKDCENDFLVVKAIEHPTLYAQTQLLLNNKRHECEEFCFRLDEVELEDDGETSTELENNSNFDEDFMNIVRKDKTIEEEDKKLASDLWNIKSTKGMQALLAQDLKEEKEREEIK